MPLRGNASVPTPSPNTTAWVEQRRRQMEEALEKGQDQWRTPIEFYGKVVDENTNAVAGARVDFDCNDTSAEGTSFYHAQSDANGLFSIKGIKGMLLSVKVNKEGYYPNLPYGNNFYYAGQNQNFVPDASNPVVFRLRKKGTPEPLIRFRNPFDVPKDGTPIQVDLATGHLAASGNANLKVECWTQDAGTRPGQQFDWKCRVSLVRGGIQLYNQEFPFTAPETGYAPSDEIDMEGRPNEQWQMDVQRHYFIRTSDGRFGRVVFRMIAHGDHFCLIESYFNPSGSRNLEFDPNNVVSRGN